MRVGALRVGRRVIELEKVVEKRHIA